MAAGLRPQRHAERIAGADRPDAGLGRAWSGSVVIRIARHAVAGDGINTEDFSIETVHKLRAVAADVFLRLDDSVGQSLHGKTAVHPAAGVHQPRAGSIAARHQQRVVLAKDQTSRAVRVGEIRDAVGLGFAEQNETAAKIDRREIVRGVAGVTRHATDGRLRVGIRIGIVIRGAEIQQVMPIHRVEQVDVSVRLEIGIERKAGAAMIAPVRNLVADVEQLREARVRRFFEPDAAGAFPDEHAAGIAERDPDSLAPGAAATRTGHHGFGKSCRDVGREQGSGDRQPHAARPEKNRDATRRPFPGAEGRPAALRIQPNLL